MPKPIQSKTQHLIGIFLVLSLLSLSVPSVSQATGTASSEAAFFELYAKTIRMVDQGELDLTVEQKARALMSDLQKKIDTIEMRLSKIKQEIASSDSNDHDNQLNTLVALGAEKEKTYRHYLQRLYSLTATNQSSQSPSPPPATATPVENQKIKTNVLTFRSIPEDVTKGDFD